MSFVTSSTAALSSAATSSRRCVCCTAVRIPEPSVSRDMLQITRRSVMQGHLVALAALVTGTASPVQAGPAQDLLRKFVRPDMADAQAVVILYDARGTLKELSTLAASDKNSDLRFNSRKLLPGMAKRLREVGIAAPIVATLGGSSEGAISSQYGGAGGITAAADPVYQAIGQVVTLSGRTIRDEAQASPLLAQLAIERIDALLAVIPEELRDKAQQLRKARVSKA